MVDRHYSHLTAVLAAEELTKRVWPKDDPDEAVEEDDEEDKEGE